MRDPFEAEAQQILRDQTAEHERPVPFEHVWRRVSDRHETGSGLSSSFAFLGAAVLVGLAAIVILRPSFPSSGPIAHPSPPAIGQGSTSPQARGTPEPCMTGLIQGQLISETTSLILVDEAGTHWRVIWPSDFVVTERSGKLVLLDGEAAVLATEGDSVSLDGGEWGPSSESRPGWRTCRAPTLLPTR